MARDYTVPKRSSSTRINLQRVPQGSARSADPMSMSDTARAQSALSASVTRLEADPADGAAWVDASRAMARLGANTDALDALRQGCSLCPEYADLHVELGTMLDRMNVRHEPEAAYRQALSVDPHHIGARIRLGNLRLNAADLDEAGACFLDVLRRQPTNSAATAGAANVLHRRGHRDEAWKLVTAANVRPSIPLALSAATIGLRTGRSAEALRIVKRQLKRARGHDRVLLLHARGELHDALDQTGHAWRAWDEANRSRGLAFDCDAHVKAIDALIAAVPHAPAPTGPDDPRPVFVVGMPRSGTTLIESVLDAHPAMHGAGELEWVRDLIRSIPSLAGEGRTWLDHADDLGAFGSALGHAYLEGVDARAPNALRFIDKMPNNALHLAVVSTMLPAARIIWCERDDDDTALSCFQKCLSGGLPWATSLAGIRSWQRGLHRLKAHWERVLPTAIHTVRYSEFVRDPETQTRALTDFLDMPYDPAMLAFHQGNRAVATASWDQVSEPIHTRRIGRSRRYAAPLDRP